MVEKRIKCLDHGFVRLVDHMGNDDAIVQAARCSYGEGTTKKSKDRELIRYLLRHQHMSPFEMVEIKLHCKMPIFVARQWVRHRTASINEYSQRYSEAMNECYTPELEQLCKQDNQINFQGKASQLPEDVQFDILNKIDNVQNQSFELYYELLQSGLARELSRIVMPVSNYTQWYWKCDLRNIFNFLKLRMDLHAQYEIRVYAEAISEIVKEIVPVAYEAFEDYVLYAKTFSRQELDVLREFQKLADIEVVDTYSIGDLSKREQQEFLDKLK